MFRVIIAGTRTFDNYGLLYEYADYKLSQIQDNIEIVSGGAKGADALGERYAREKGYSLRVFPADWAKYGRKAGPMRNRQMAEYADALLAFWDGESAGTKNMIEEANKQGLKIGIRIYKEKVLS